MIYYKNYNSPLGKILIASTETNIIGLWFEGQRYFKFGINEEMRINEDLPILVATSNWLDRYFKGENPNAKEISIKPDGSEFQHLVWRALCEIPYGKVTSYGEIAKTIAKIKGGCKVSARAVGVAIGRNPIAILIPCHRVVGATRNLTGFSAGLDKKIWLLKRENVNLPSLAE